jgi:hypothetical protein
LVTTTPIATVLVAAILIATRLVAAIPPPLAPPTAVAALLRALGLGRRSGLLRLLGLGLLSRRRGPIAPVGTTAAIPARLTPAAAIAPLGLRLSLRLSLRLLRL